MSNSIFLAKQFLKSITRERFMIVLIISLPIILVFVGAMSAPDREIQLVLENELIDPAPSTLEISVTLYVLTGLVLVTSLISFFIGMDLKYIIPRLKQYSYTSLDIILAFIFVIVLLDFILSITIIAFSMFWLDINIDNFLGFFVGLFLSGLIFSTIGLIISKIADTVAMGLYLILTLSVLDSAFLENPIFSRRYNEDWMYFMPANYSIRLIFRAIFDLKTKWTDNIGTILLYELILIIIFLIVSKVSENKN